MHFKCFRATNRDRPQLTEKNHSCRHPVFCTSLTNTAATENECYVLCSLSETPALDECQCVSRVAAMMFRHSRFCFYPFCPQRTFVFIMQSYYVSKETQVLHQNPPYWYEGDDMCNEQRDHESSLGDIKCK